MSARSDCCYEQRRVYCVGDHVVHVTKIVYEYELSADFGCNVGTFVDIFFVDCSFPVVVQ